MKIAAWFTSFGYVLLGFGAAFAFQQDPAKLPPPFATKSVNNAPKVVPKPEGAKVSVPKGFEATEFLADFRTPRFMLLGPSNEILLSDSAKGTDGKVYVITTGSNFSNPQKKVLIEGLDRPYGLALWKDYLYVGEPNSVKRYRYNFKNLTTGPGEEIIKLEGMDQGGHWTRSLLFDAKGEKLYVGVGSASNVNAGEDPRRAAINVYNPDGSGHELFAEGTRNPIGIHWYPGTQDLWAAIQERDGLGDDLVPDYLTKIQKGGFYGWPFAYTGKNEDPRRKGEKPELVAKTIVPDMLLGSHVAVLDFVFYTGTSFPEHYRNGAFVALHGSWNRSKRVGQEIAFIPFKNGKPSGRMEHFLTGWLLSPDRREVWGRPVAVLQLPDGSLLISDDGGRKLWRVTYKG